MVNIFVAGHKGMVGSAICRRLKSSSYVVLTAERRDLDLTNQMQVNSFFAENKIDQVYLAAAKVGGIQANNEYPANFIYENIMIEANVIHAAFQHNVDKLLFLGSTCIYPRSITQPIREADLLTATLEPTNEPYAIAKIAGIKLCESYNRQHQTDFRSVMPTNLYGINDNFHYENSHVVPGLIRRVHEAKVNKDPKVVVWGSGKPKREFLFVDDMVDAAIFIMSMSKKKYALQTEPMLSHINIGSGVDICIQELAEKIKNIIGYDGELIFDPSKPDGVKRKLTDISRLKHMGWTHKVCLEEGLRITYDWYLESIKL